MGIGALIGAYQEDDGGQLRALLPLAGRTLIDYQVRAAAAAGASPIVVVVERVPRDLQDALERLRLDGIAVSPVSDIEDAVTRFEAGAMILLIGDGIVAPAELIAEIAAEPEAAIATVPDDEMHEAFERIDADSRWAGVALIDSRLLGSTAAILGDWDLQSTLLRRAVQDGAARLPAGERATMLAESAEQLAAFERGLVRSTRATRSDWPSRFLLPPIEELATVRLLDTQVRPQWLIWAALALTLAGAVAFLRGWPIAALALLLLSTPLDLIAARLAGVRLKPLPVLMPSRRALWPAAGLALVALGWWEAGQSGDWAPLIAAVSAGAFAEAARMERAVFPPGTDLWLFSRRGAIVAALPFAVFGAWTFYLIALWLYAAASFFIVQHVRHSARELTPN
jgi:hypothetical protein